MSIPVKQILHERCISYWCNEPNQTSQNFAKSQCGTPNAGTHCVMKVSAAPAKTWLKVLPYVCLLIHHLASFAI
jgi:hypothetical protein